MPSESASSPNCPSPETLAEFLDGGLSTSARAAIEAHLATCEDCFEQVAAAAAFQAEHNLGSREVAKWPQRSASSPARRWSLAAGAAAALAVGLWLAVGGHQAPKTDPEALAGLAQVELLGGPAALTAAAQNPWNETRGSLAFDGRLSAQKRAFRLGVHLFDAAVALAAADEPAWRTALDRSRHLFLLPTTEGRRTLSAETIFGRSTKGTDRAQRNEDLAALASLARSIEPDAFDLGLWVESCRLAALGATPSKELPALLTQTSYWSRLENLRRSPALATEPAVSRALDDLVRARLGSWESPESVDSLIAGCEQVLRLF